MGSPEELSAGRRRLAVERSRRFWNWALAERLCEESERAAAHRATRRRSWRGSRAGRRAGPGNEAWRSGLLGWVWAFVANPWRSRAICPARGGFFALRPSVGGRGIRRPGSAGRLAAARSEGVAGAVSGPLRLGARPARPRSRQRYATPMDPEWIDLPGGRFGWEGDPATTKTRGRGAGLRLPAGADAGDTRGVPAFLDATAHPAPPFWGEPAFSHPRMPAVGPSWEDAAAFCAWARRGRAPPHRGRMGARGAGRPRRPLSVRRRSPRVAPRLRPALARRSGAGGRLPLPPPARLPRPGGERP